MNNCIDCGAPIQPRSTRCKRCSVVYRNKNPKVRAHLRKMMLGRKITWDTCPYKHHSEETKRKLSEAHKGKVLSEAHRAKISKTLKRRYKNGQIPIVNNRNQRHHIDMNHQNTLENNILVLTASQHRKIHAWAYNYLVEQGQIHVYVNWFKQKFL